MSIINEALKKTENSILQNEAKKNASADKKIKAKPFLLYILILLIGIFLSNFIFSLLGHKAKIAQTPEKTTPQQPLALPIFPPQPMLPQEEHKTPPGTFVLNGIFFSNDDSYALINNQIVRENESVDGAKVVAITENTVELDNQGKSITLSSGK